MKSVIVILFHLFPFFVVAQEEKDSAKIAKNTFFIEGLGNGFWYSVNYDRILLYKNNTKITGRLGVSFLYKSILNSNDNIWAIPFEMNILMGKKHHFEFGLGITYSYGANSYGDYYGRIFNSSSLWLMPRIIGYRFQKRQGSFFIKAGIPVFIKIIELNKEYENDGRYKTSNIFPFLGIGLGYTLKNKKQ